jgi:plastocyanin
MNGKRGLLFLFLLLLAGCAAPAQSAADPQETSKVTMPPSYRFDPVAIKVAAGTTVTWENSDNFSHSVKVTNADLPYIELKPGESGQITFAEPGDYTYICTFHATDMSGTVTVTPP